MIKRTLYFGNPAYLSKKEDQLRVRLPEVENNKSLPDSFKKNSTASIPIEDIGVVILDHQQITVTHALIDALLENNTALITCDSTHHPTGLMLPLCGNKIQTERFRTQIEASEPLKKNLWQQTIAAKITNQAEVLRQRGFQIDNMSHWAKKVRSGDPDNLEGRAAAYYWKTIFPELDDFKRGRFEVSPNNLLNYGYAILRAVVARGLVSSGLLPTFGIHHRNKYNAYCLADDIMEPYRPFVDKLVCEIIQNGEDYTELSPSLKRQLLGIPVLEIIIDGEKSPLMVGLQRTTASLVKCYEGTLRKIVYPEF